MSNDDNTYTIEINWSDIDAVPSYLATVPEVTLTEDEVRKLAMKLPQNVLRACWLHQELTPEPMSVKKDKDAEQQRVSDCWCGGEVSGLNPNKCVAGKENCDAVESDDKIDREGLLDMLKDLRSDMASDYLGEDVTLSNFLQQTEKFNKKFTKLNEIIEKINND